MLFCLIKSLESNAPGKTPRPKFLFHGSRPEKLKSAKTIISKDTILFFQGIISFGIIVFALFNFSGRLPWNRNFGLGVLPGAFDSSDFIKQNNIQGPIFNNYDIGSSIDFTLFPQEKAFVDNRPEAYPAEFFSDVYIPMQENPDAFAQVDSRYHFNAIYFYRLDMTPWGQQFLVAMVKNPDWAPVYVDAE